MKRRADRLVFDGDADRLIAIDEDGRVANGDVILAIVARYMKAQGTLKKNLVVATVMSNLGFRKSMAEAEIDLVETQVGDRYVMEAMLENKAILGGEQSGHIIFLDKGHTGDGLSPGCGSSMWSPAPARSCESFGPRPSPSTRRSFRMFGLAAAPVSTMPALLGRGTRRGDRVGRGGQGPGPGLGHRAPDQGHGGGPFRRGGETLR